MFLFLRLPHVFPYSFIDLSFICFLICCLILLFFFYISFSQHAFFYRCEHFNWHFNFYFCRTLLHNRLLFIPISCNYHISLIFFQTCAKRYLIINNLPLILSLPNVVWVNYLNQTTQPPYSRFTINNSPFFSFWSDSA